MVGSRIVEVGIVIRRDERETERLAWLVNPGRLPRGGRRSCADTGRRPRGATLQPPAARPVRCSGAHRKRCRCGTGLRCTRPSWLGSRGLAWAGLYPDPHDSVHRLHHDQVRPVTSTCQTRGDGRPKSGAGISRIGLDLLDRTDDDRGVMNSKRPFKIAFKGAERPLDRATRTSPAVSCKAPAVTC